MWWSRPRYSLLLGGSTPEPKRTPSSWAKSLLMFLLIAIVSFGAGRYSTRTANTFNILSLNTEKNTFIYNRTFAEKSNTSDVAWETLFPRQNGYFTHPVIAPQRSTFSVFHLLHCLNGIREGYWAVHDVAIAGETLNDSSLPMMISPPHIRHCIDLLRQNLMCHADLTVEIKDTELNGVHGFGTEHTCLDWNGLLAWTKEWETGQTGGS